MLNLYRLKHGARCEEHLKITGDILELLFQFFYTNQLQINSNDILIM